MQRKTKMLFNGSRGGPRISRAALAVFVPMLLAATAFAQTGPPPTVVGFPWDWHIEVIPNDSTVPIPIGLWGNAIVEMRAPELVGGSGPPTFDIGPGGFGTNFPSNEAPPEGGIYQIPIELVQLELTSMMPVQFSPGGPLTDVIIRQDPTRPTRGMIQNMQNLGDGTMAVDSFFDIFVEIQLPQLGMTLRNDEPMRAGMSFGNVPNPNPDFGPPGLPLPVLDTPWIPTWIWRNFFNNQDAPNWVDTSGLPWDRWISVHGHVTVPEPSTLGLLLASLLVPGLARRRCRS